MDGPGAASWVDVIAQLATAGGFAALVWYLMIKHIPGIEERHRNDRGEWIQEMKSIHQNCEERIATLHEEAIKRSEKMVEQMVQAIERLK